MEDEPQFIWTCPTCNKPVRKDLPYVSATEGEDGAGTHEPVWGSPVRFHVGHYESRLRGKLYRRERSRV